ncbi:hypothetical protein A4X09_0g385 [Tilletia walkeri]|uniref:Anaphase-promoting complex subunit 5 n=1 Tax=Tilletia walkeri TaxID=117179 RepID=A0A8X7T7R8_9BASI|nr:hypothetical protein A4X09_0g385 [Tilletia walkeri]
MSASTSTSTSFGDEFTAADNFMMDPDRDDSASFTEDHPWYRGICSSYGIKDSWFPHTIPLAILELFAELVRVEDTSSNAIREGTKIGLDILKQSEETALLRREGRWFVHRALDLLNLVAAEEKASGRRVAVPGSLKYLCVRSIVQDMDQFKKLVAKNHECSIVMRSRLRTEHKLEATRHILQQKEVVREVKKKLGFVSTSCRIASLPESPSTIPAMAFRSISNLHHRSLHWGGTLLDLQADARLAAFPPLEVLLDLANFFRAIESAQIEEEEARSGKRMRATSSSDQNNHEASFELAAGQEPETPVLNDEFPKSLLLAELAQDGLAFEHMEQLNEAKNDTYELLAEMCWQWSMDDGILTDKNGFVSLQCQCIAFAKALLFDEAAAFCELLVALCREDEERAPSIKNKVRLAAALGALSVLLEPTFKNLTGTQAAEEGIKILQPLFRTNPARYISLMTALKIANAKSLLQMGRGTFSEECRIRTLRKAFRIAGEASILAQKHSDDQATEMNISISLARTLHIKACGGTSVIRRLLDYQARHRYPNCPLLPAGREEREIEAFQPSEYLKGLLKDLNVDTVDELVAVLERSIQLYREIMKQVPNLCGPLLGEALILKADLLSCYSSQAVDAYKEATKFYDNLSTTFPHQFDEPATRAYTGLAKRQLWANDLEGAADSYQKVLDHLLEPLGTNEFKTREQSQQSDRVGDLKIDRPMICLQLERYNESLADLERVRGFLGQKDDAPFCSMTVGMAVQGCCYWLQGRLEEAKGILKLAFQPIIELEETLKGIDCLHDGHWDNNQGYILTIGWQGAVKSAMGDHIHALKDGELAVKMLRKRQSKAEKWCSEHYELDPFQRVMLPHHLVILAGTLLAVGMNEDAMEHVEESLQLNSDVKMDPSTVKTALMLKARLLEETESRENFKEAAKIRAEAEAIPFRGFLHRMGCSIGRVQRRHSWST